MTFAYTVFSEVDDEATGAAWSEWLCQTHLPDVVSAGARLAELVRIDAKHFESRYQFESRAAYERYIAEHSARLRAATAEKFPEGLRLTRSAGEIVFVLNAR